MKKIETYLPIFDGFYGTLFEADGEDQEIDDINSQRESKGLKAITYDDCVFDYKYYQNRVAKKCVEIIEREINDILKTKMIFTFQSVVSPHEYNFINDSINIEVETKGLKVIKEYLKENQENFGGYLTERYTSRDGFISSWCNDPAVWFELIEKEESMQHVLGAAMDFILFNEDYDAWSLHDRLDGENFITADNYDELCEGTVLN